MIFCCVTRPQHNCHQRGFMQQLMGTDDAENHTQILGGLGESCRRVEGEEEGPRTPQEHN